MKYSEAVLNSFPICFDQSWSLSGEKISTSWKVRKHLHVISANASAKFYLWPTNCTSYHRQGVTGGMYETSGECSLGQTIPI
jgi:hypothetical protein